MKNTKYLTGHNVKDANYGEQSNDYLTKNSIFNVNQQANNVTKKNPQIKKYSP